MKKIITIISIIMLLFSFFAVYTVNYATGETPTVTPQQWYGTTNAYIGVKFKIENLDNEKKYEYALLTTNSTPADSDWKTVYVNTDSSTTADVTYAVSSGNNEEVFRTQDHIYFSLRTVTYQSSGKEYSTIIDKQKCSLLLPDFLSERISLSAIINTVSFKPIFGIKKGQYQFVKITDTNVIEKYKAYASDKTEVNLSALKAVLPSESSAPSSGWNDFVTGTSYNIPDENGYYFVWMKAHEENTITLLGINIIEVTNKVDPSNNSANSGNGGTSTSTPKTDPDETVATTILPKAGISLTVVLAILGMSLITIVSYKKYKTWKDIK